MLVLHRHSFVVYCQAEAGCFVAGRDSPEDPTYNRDADADSHSSRDVVTGQICSAEGGLTRTISSLTYSCSLAPAHLLFVFFSISCVGLL